jgi:hypothetical protein
MWYDTARPRLYAIEAAIIPTVTGNSANGRLADLIREEWRDFRSLHFPLTS